MRGLDVQWRAAICDASVTAVFPIAAFRLHL
jgi:hypothetical protein